MAVAPGPSYAFSVIPPTMNGMGAVTARFPGRRPCRGELERGFGGFGWEETAEYVRGETVRECHQGRGGDLGIGRHLARSQVAGKELPQLAHPDA